MKNHIAKVVNVLFVEKVLEWNVTSLNIIKKTLDCFLFQVGDINITYNFYKIKNLN